MDFVKTFMGICSFAVISSPFLGAADAKKTVRKPNVVIFFTDDQGAIDLNCFGSKDLCTPNIDSLAAKGVMFTHFYANSSVSSPSRASLMTGRYPQMAGIDRVVSSLPDRPGLPASEITIADLLKEDGYATGLVGKWHLGTNKEAHPNSHGFDYFFGNLGGCIDNYSHFFYWNGPNRHDLYRNREEVWYEGQNYSDLMVHEAEAFISSHKQEPFFLYFSSNYPHYPLQGDAQWRRYYENLPSPRDKYAASVSTIDQKIGYVIEHLRKENLLDNTVIIFMSDNGFSTEERTFSGGGSAGNLRGSKGSVYEGGIRVPAILSYPKAIPTGIVCDEIGLGADWLPTILDLCGIRQPSHHIDGASLLPVIKGEKTTHDVINWQVGTKWAVYKGGYKLIGEVEGPDEKLELYCLDKDIEESDNIVSKEPSVVKDLLAERAKWLKSIENGRKKHKK